MKVITGKVRFSYANVWEPKSINGGDPKYSVSLIIPKADKATLNKVKEAIEEAKKEGMSKLGGSIPDNLKMPLRDGDVDRVEEESYKDSYFINANSNTKPGIVDKSVQTITDKSEFYSGCYGRASITFYAYNVDGNKGIACGLENLQKLEDGEALGGHSRAEDDFNTAADNFLD